MLLQAFYRPGDRFTMAADLLFVQLSRYCCSPVRTTLGVFIASIPRAITASLLVVLLTLCIPHPLWRCFSADGTSLVLLLLPS